MKVLIVHAHENPDSFCSSLAKQASRILTEHGHEVHKSDLYKMDFNPVASKKDFTALSDSAYYKFALEQLNASKFDLFDPTLKQEMNKLTEADLLILNFPLWWFGFPAILKGWVDRVMAYGVAYGGDYGFHDKGRFVGKKAMLCITTGSPKEKYSASGANKRSLDLILQNIHDGILGLVGFEILSPFIAFGVSWIDQESREKLLESYTKKLHNLEGKKST